MCVYIHTYIFTLGETTCIPADPNFDISSLDYNVTTISSALKAFFKLLPRPSNCLLANVDEATYHGLGQPISAAQVAEVMTTLIDKPEIIPDPDSEGAD